MAEAEEWAGTPEHADWTKAVIACATSVVSSVAARLILKILREILPGRRMSLGNRVRC